MTINIDYIVQQFRDDIERAIEVAVKDRMYEERVKLMVSIDEIETIKDQLSELSFDIDQVSNEAAAIHRSIDQLDLPWQEVES